MTVDRHEVRRIADLARLGIDDGEVDRLTNEMNDILEHAERLRGLVGEPETAQGPEPPRGADAVPRGGTRGVGAERPDELFESIASFAPEEADGFFVVPPPPGVSDHGIREQAEVDT